MPVDKWVQEAPEWGFVPSPAFAKMVAEGVLNYYIDAATAQVCLELAGKSSTLCFWCCVPRSLVGLVF